MEIQNYFDNAATTPVDPRVLQEMLPYLQETCGNANSIHSWGQAALAAVQRAQERIAELIGAEDPSQVLFTSGATEANNWVLNQASSIAISPFEHSAILEPAKRRGAEILKTEGFALSLPTGEADLLSVMTVNNEIGSLLALPNGSRSRVNVIHRDMTQHIGKLKCDLDDIDFASFSGHKFYGPKGTGALYAKDTLSLRPFILGGEQQHGLRGGTLNVPGIVGMGVAASIAGETMHADHALAVELRAIVLESIQRCSDWQVNGGIDCSPYILSLSFSGVEGESLVIELDHHGFAVSSGAACSSRSTDPSHVLLALQIPSEWLRGTIRISFGRFNTKESARQLGNSIVSAVQSLRNLRTI